MSDYDRMMARSYCKILACLDPEHELLKYRLPVYLSYGELFDGCFRPILQEFIERFSSDSVLDEILERLDIEEGDHLFDDYRRSWFERSSVPAFRNYYKALFAVVSARGADHWSSFWGDFAGCVDSSGALRTFDPNKVKPIKREKPLWQEPKVVFDPDAEYLVQPRWDEDECNYDDPEEELLENKEYDQEESDEAPDSRKRNEVSYFKTIEEGLVVFQHCETPVDPWRHLCIEVTVAQQWTRTLVSQDISVEGFEKAFLEARQPKKKDSRSFLDFRSNWIKTE